MKITEISKEYLEKGGLIRRKVWDSSISIGLSTSKNDFIYYKNSKPKKPITFLRGLVQDIMADDWELNENPTQVWKPRKGDTYYTIDSVGCVASCIYGNDAVDELFIRIGNCFESREEASHMTEKLKIINKLRELSNGDFYRNCTEVKYVIWYDSACKVIKINTHEYIRELPFSIYFATKKDAEKAVETIGEENLKKYYFDIEE